MPGLAMGDCDYGKYFDEPAGRCEDCEGICLSKYGTMKQCARECYDYAVDKGFLPSGACPPVTDLGFNNDWLFLLIPMFILAIIGVWFGIWVEKKWKISEKLCCFNSPKLGGEQPVEQANQLMAEREVVTGTGQNHSPC